MTPLRPVGFGGQAEDRVFDFGFGIVDFGLSVIHLATRDTYRVLRIQLQEASKGIKRGI